MNIVLYDPKPPVNDYFTTMFARPLMDYRGDIRLVDRLDGVKNCAVIILTNHLNEALIQRLKNDGCKIIGFNVTDSSYFSESIRHCNNLEAIDKIFMVSGIPIRNDSQDFRVTPDFEIEMFDYPFLPDHEWEVFHRMHDNDQLHSLPYVTWAPIPDKPWMDHSMRSQKVLLRGGGHSRRFILGMFLMRHQMLDTNSGLILFPYADDGMNPDFKFCDMCRAEFRQNKKFLPGLSSNGCTSPAVSGNFWSMENLGFWNNRCPRSFYWMADQFQKRHGPLDIKELEVFLNGKWLTDGQHQEMLSRILFTSDLKWIHSIYAPQRFWQGAAAGAINLLPARTRDQEFFPFITAGVHYVTFEEHLDLTLKERVALSMESIKEVAISAKNLYETWIRPSKYHLNTNLMDYILNEV